MNKQEFQKWLDEMGELNAKIKDVPIGKEWVATTIKDGKSKVIIGLERNE